MSADAKVLTATEQLQADRADIVRSLTEHRDGVLASAQMLFAIADAGIVGNATLLSAVAGLYAGHASLVTLIAGVQGFVLGDIK